MKHYAILLLLLLSATTLLTAQSGSPYAQRVAADHRDREAKLLAEDGWVNLAGRFPLPAGRSSFGAASDHPIVFPGHKCPDRLGHFVLRNDSVWVELEPGSGVLANGKAAESPVRVFPSEQLVVLQSGVLRWTVIKRADRFFVRLRDLEHPALKAFKGIPTYPADSTWRVTARLERSPGKKIPITNVLGQTTLQDSPGTLVFDLKGATYRLDAVEDDQRLFILFADATTGVETYGTGRFLYADPPDANGQTVLDFNYAINPPCAFTEFAVCPLPPKQNGLPIAVTAGEKNVH